MLSKSWLKQWSPPQQQPNKQATIAVISEPIELDPIAIKPIVTQRKGGRKKK